MTETDSTLATIDAVLESDSQHEFIPSEDTVDAEVVSDTVEEAAAPRRTRKSKAQRSQEQQNTDGETEVRDVPAAAPTTEKSEFTPKQARDFTERIQKATENAAELFVKAWNGRIWLAYGDQYNTGKPVADAVAWVKSELGSEVPKLAPSRRRELVAEIKNGTHASQSAIAELLGVDQKTVSNDIKALNGQAEESGEEPVVDTSASEGLDGRVTSGNSGSRGRERSYADKLHAAVESAFNALGKVQELRAEDGWDDEGRVYRGQLHRLSQEFAGLRDTLQETDDYDADNAE